MGHKIDFDDRVLSFFLTKVLLSATTKMPYGFSQSSGRISQQGGGIPKAFGAAVPEPEIIYASSTKFVAAHDPKSVSTNLPNNYGEVLQKMKAFQVDNKLPIHLKGGPRDMMLFSTTLAICGVGLFGCFKFFYDMSFPKKA